MAVSIGGAPNMVELFDGDTIGDWTNSNRLSLDGFNSEIEGAGCVAISLAKNSNVTYSHTAPAGINIPEDTDADLGTREQVPSAAITGEYKGQAIINSYTTIGGILNTYSITLNDEQTPTAGTATFDILPEFTGATSSLILKSFVATAFDLTAGTLAFDEGAGVGYASADFNYNVQNVNLRAVDNAFIDIGYAGSGINIFNDTDSDSLFREIVDADISGDTHYGVLQSFEGVIFAQHNLALGGGVNDVQISRNENLNFIETLNGTNSYFFKLDNVDVQFFGTNIQTTGDCILDCFAHAGVGSSRFIMNGGSFKKARSFLLYNSTSTTLCRQQIQNVVFEDVTYVNTGLGGANSNSANGFFKNNTLTNISGLWIESTFENNTLLNCDSVRAYNINHPSSSDLTISGCTITNSGRIDTTLQDSLNANTSCVITNCTFDSSGRLDGAALFADSATFNDITGCTFTRSVSTNAAVELRVDGNVTLDWDNNTLTGYGTGTAGTDVASTANGAIAANFISNSTLTLNVTNGSTVPTVEKIGTGTVNIVNNAIVSLTRLLGNTEISVLDNPSPYSATSLPAPSITTVASTERVSADTNTGDGGSNYIGYINSGGFIRIVAFGTTAFSNFPGVLQDTNATNPRGLAAGDRIRVTIRDDADNPSLQLFDEFEVSGDATTTLVIDTTTAFSGFTSVFGDTLSGANSKTVTVEKVDARFQFETPLGNVIDILAFRTGSDPVLSLENTAETGNIPLTQTGDRNYRDPA
jgi:hypothetical protein